MRRIGFPFVLSAALGIILWLPGCSSGSDGAGPTGSPAPGTGQGGQFTGVALPSSYSLDSGKSLALGVGERWIGRIVFTSGTSSGDMFDFYRSEMPKYGWTEGAVVRAETSILTFNSPSTNRTAVVQISSRTLGGAYVEMVVSPNGSTDIGSATTQGSGNGVGARSVPVAKPAARPPGVSVQPLQ
jgi:hypothetical protein